jgi:hypothetical protein
MRHRTLPAPAGGDGENGSQPHDRLPRSSLLPYMSWRRKKPLAFETKGFLDSCNLPWSERATRFISVATAWKFIFANCGLRAMVSCPSRSG